MIVLDCQSYESALLSFSKLFDISQESILDILYNAGSPEAMEERCRISIIPGDEILRTDFEKQLKGIPKFDSTVWFHGTRLDEDNTITQEGLLILSQMKPRIYKMLMKYVSEIDHKEWMSIIKKVEEFFSIRGKDSHVANGPFAFLICEPITHYYKETCCNRDYLQGSELIEDIRDGIGSPHGDRIFDAYLTNTRPAIVKFKSDYLGYEVDTALTYLWAKFWKVDNIFSCAYNTCYDGNGVAISPDNIISILYC